MKPGRNDLCPCGSGRKYKHCCLANQQAAGASSGELAWRRIRRAHDDLIPKMLRFVTQAYGESAVEEAWDEFMLWDEEGYEDWYDSAHQPVFLPWLLHRWTPDPNDDTTVPDASLHDVPPTRAFLERHARHLDPVTQRYLKACLAAPFTFYEILDVEPGRHFRVRELIFGQEHLVVERSATQTMEAGEILFGALAQSDGVVMLEACAPVVIPPRLKQPLMKARKQIVRDGESWSAELLAEWDIELRMLYLDLAQQILNPAMPELRNTDGDPLSMQRLIFEIDSAEETFDALKHLALDMADEDLLAGAQRDADGTLRRIEFRWLRRGNATHEQWDSTTLGNIEIDGNRLSVDVNSQQRAERFRGIVDEALGQRARYRITEIQSADQDLAESDHDDALSMDEIQNMPEVQEALWNMLSQHYSDWVNQKLPALNDETPLEAVRKADGREMVEALVRQIELDGRRMSPPLDEAITRRLRERLGLLLPAR